MLYLLFKRIKPYTPISVSNQKYDIGKENLIKSGNNVKNLIDDMSSNYTIIIYKGGSMRIIVISSELYF